MEQLWNLHEYYDMFRWIAFIGDTHVGHERFNTKELKRVVRKIAASSSYRVILMGDYFEMALKNKMRVEQEIETNAQLDKFLAIIDPIKDRIIAVLRGNHEERIEGIDYVKTALMPHLPNAVYLGYEGFIKVGNGVFPPTTMYLHHGAGKSSQPQHFIEQALFKVGVQTIADLIAVAHVHKLWNDTYYVPAVDGQDVIPRPVLALRTGSFLTDAAYARKAGFRISKTGCYRYDLNTRKLEVI